MAGNPNQQPSQIGPARLIALQFVTPLLLAVFMFWPAGTIWWTRGWLFLLAFSVAAAVAAIVLQRVNPDVVTARSRFHEGTKGWDKVLLALLFPSFLAIVSVAALDESRFHWFPVAWWICGWGYATLALGFAGLTWATAVNRFFEPTVRIQSDRGHAVITTGPYAIVRHPGYAAALPVFVGMALAMGSLWALIPGLIAFLVLVLRAHWEDAMLQAELPGYKEYAQKVRYKLIPGVW
jgi:protein-S-isoprenylcysteine O-methyltransferase Ste14